MNRFKKVLKPPLIIIASVVMFIEESLWAWLKKLTAWIALVPMVHKLETWILQLPPYAAMFAFLLPMATLFPLKILAVYWLSRGYWMTSLALVVAAKVLGTAIVARMYVVCHPKLMTIDWFRRLHDWLIAIQNQIYTALRSLRAYQLVTQFLASIKLRVRRNLTKIQELFRRIRDQRDSP